MMTAQEIIMPATAIPVLAAVVAAFAFFIIAVGGASIWTSSPGRPGEDRREGPDNDL